MKTETTYLMEANNGMLVSVPASKLDEWVKTQDLQRDKQRSSLLTKDSETEYISEETKQGLLQTREKVRMAFENGGRQEALARREHLTKKGIL